MLDEEHDFPAQMSSLVSQDKSNGKQGHNCRPQDEELIKTTSNQTHQRGGMLGKRSYQTAKEQTDDYGDDDESDADLEARDRVFTA